MVEVDKEFIGDLLVNGGINFPKQLSRKTVDIANDLFSRSKNDMELSEVALVKKDYPNAVQLSQQAVEKAAKSFFLCSGILEEEDVDKRLLSIGHNTPKAFLIPLENELKGILERVPDEKENYAKGKEIVNSHEIKQEIMDLSFEQLQAFFIILNIEKQKAAGLAKLVFGDPGSIEGFKPLVAQATGVEVGADIFDSEEVKRFASIVDKMCGLTVVFYILGTITFPFATARYKGDFKQSTPIIRILPQIYSELSSAFKDLGKLIELNLELIEKQEQKSKTTT